MACTSIVGCPSDPAPVARSVPATPTRDLAPQEPALVVSDLGDLLPETPASLPPSLAGLTPGMDGEAARKILEDAHEPGVKLFGEPGEQQYALSSLLAGRPTVGATLIFDSDGRALREVDLSVPDEVAVPMVTTRWGAPDEQTPGIGAKMTLRWTPKSGPWRAELIPGATREKALLRYLPR